MGNIQYHVEYQFMPKGASRPQDEGSTLDANVSEDEVALLPNTGDYVSIDNSAAPDLIQKISGRVRSRVFHYNRLTPKEGEHSIVCHINIVLEEVDGKIWGELIKE